MVGHDSLNTGPCWFNYYVNRLFNEAGLVTLLLYCEGQSVTLSPAARDGSSHLTKKRLIPVLLSSIILTTHFQEIQECLRQLSLDHWRASESVDRHSRHVL